MCVSVCVCVCAFMCVRLDQCTHTKLYSVCVSNVSMCAYICINLSFIQDIVIVLYCICSVGPFHFHATFDFWLGSKMLEYSWQRSLAAEVGCKERTVKKKEKEKKEKASPCLSEESSHVHHCCISVQFKLIRFTRVHYFKKINKTVHALC